MLRHAFVFLTLSATIASAQSLCFCPRCFLGTHANLNIMSESMAPALLPDDCAEARYLLQGDPPPTPGQIVVFDHPVTGALFVKRLVATAGQTVQMIGGVLHIDNRPLAMAAIDPFVRPFAPQGPLGSLPLCGNAPVADGGDCISARAIETLPNGVSYAVVDSEVGSIADDTEPLVVPPGHVFVLGDNRDNSMDSRMSRAVGGVGFVPVENIGAIIESE